MTHGDGVQTSANQRDGAAADQRRWWEVVFGCDLRSLAILRVMLGVVGILDVTLRWPDLAALYSDAGYFSRDLMRQYYEQTAGPAWDQAIWSLHALSGDVWFQQALFILQGAAGVLLIAGASTRIATMVLWVLVASSQARSPLVITSGDMLFKLLLFWSLFLPLGRIWSVDARLGRRTVHSERLWICNLATAGIILQIILMYFFTGVAKFNDIWFHGVALDFVLRLDLFANSWGARLVELTTLNRIISWGTLFIELVAIWLLLVPWRNALWRVLVMAAYWLFHLGIGATMTIGLFPLICMTAWLAVLPAEVWPRVVERHGALPRRGAAIWISRFRDGWCAAMIGLMVCWNLYNMNAQWTKPLMPTALHYLGHWTAMHQHFQMFGVPPKYNPWFVFEAYVEGDAAPRDIFCTEGRLHHRRPASVRDTLPGHNWRRLLHNLVNDEVGFLRQPLLDYAVRKWDAEHPDRQVRSARLLNYMQELGPGYRADHWTSRTWGKYSRIDSDPGKAIDDALQRLLEGSGAL